MYSASAQYKTAIKADTVNISWTGTITTVGGTVYSFTHDDIPSGAAATITRTISSQSLKIGTVFSSALSIVLILPGVSRYELINGEIEISTFIDGIVDVIPMGKFIITKANQTADTINIEANDNMLKFAAVPFDPVSNNTIMKPYTWLSDLCLACGVTLGSSSADIEAMPNGNRNTGFADVVSDASTWRDVLGYMAAYLGGFAYIGRDGKLYIGQYKSLSDDTITAHLRYSSALSDFRTTYDGLYAICKEEGVQEYVSNNNSGGLVLDMGTNPFLQFTDQTNRLAALQEIIDVWNGIYYVPFSGEIALIPIYDPGDVLTFTDNQAGVYDIGAITQIVYSFNSKMTVTCAGDNPYLAEAQDRFSKTVAGLSKDYNNGQESGAKNFWLLHTENTSSLTVGNTKTKVAQIDWKQTVDVQRMGFMFTAEASLSATATVKILITVDDEASYEFEVTEEKAMIGKRVFTSTCGFRVTGKGNHSAIVYMTVTDTPTLWSDME